MDWNPRGRIALIGTLDTKGDEILFLDWSEEFMGKGWLGQLAK